MTATDAVDAWWHNLPAERRWSIYRWLTTGSAPLAHPEVEGQQALPFPTTKGSRR